MIPIAVSHARDKLAAEASSGYLGTESHNLSVAGRILAALSDKQRVVLVIGDPPPDPQPLSQALRKLAGPRGRVIGITSGPELTPDELSRAGSVVATLPAGGGTVTLSDTSDTASLLFVFDAADRLSDRQIAEVCGYIHKGAGESTAAVLLISAKFLARLQEPPLGALRDAVALRLRFDEIGDDEGIDFLRHQLASRQREDEARQGRPILLSGLTVLGVIVALAAAALFIVHYTQLPALRTPPSAPSTPWAGNASTSVAPKPAPTERSVPPVTALPSSTETPDKPAPPASQTPASSQTPVSSQRPASSQTPVSSQIPASSQTRPSTQTPPSAQPEKMAEPTASFLAPGAPDTAASQEAPRSARSEPERHLSSAEIAALVARGDAFLSAGDIASARLFYERAADAGNGGAALRLGATFDPNFLGRAGVRGNQGDPAQAESWYRRARDLGDAGAAERLKTLDQQPR